MNTQGSLAGWANVGDDLKYDWRAMIQGLNDKAKLLTTLTVDQLRRRWEAAGSHTLDDYGFVWVHIEGHSAFDGVSYINDVKHRKMFQIMVEDTVLQIDRTTETAKYWEMIACLVAKFVGLAPLHEVIHLPLPAVTAPKKRKRR